MKKINQHDNRYFYKVLKYLKRKPRTREEAQEAVDKIFPNSDMKIDWNKKEIGKYIWEGKIKNPIIKRKITSNDCMGYDLAHGLMSWIFNREHKGSGGIASSIYGCIYSEPISHRQEKRIEKLLNDNSGVKID